MFSNVHRHLLLLQVLLWLSLTVVYNAEACTRTAKKVFINDRITEVSEHTCFSAESLRVDDTVPGLAAEDLGNGLNVQECKQFCFHYGYEGKIIALTPTECHCNKFFNAEGQRKVAKCDTPCPGDSQALCGGVGYVSAYPTS